MLYVGTTFELYFLSASKKQGASGYSNNNIYYTRILFVYMCWSKIIYFWPKYNKKHENN